nr:unnamed protein product [Callosobruchus chinensis]
MQSREGQLVSSVTRP